MTARLEESIVARLAHGHEERFELALEELPGLRLVLQRVLQTPQVLFELTRALALSVALRETLGSPRAGERVLHLLKSEPRAVELIRKELIKTGAIDEVRAFRHAEDRAEPLTAPRFDSRSPGQSGIPLSCFLDPAGGRVPRVIRRTGSEDRLMSSRR
jgi:hypothetical protein